jgi:CHAT domain-containing protein
MANDEPRADMDQHHLAEDLLKRLGFSSTGEASSSIGEEQARAHLDSCEICQMRVIVLRRGGQSIATSLDKCPPDTSWYEVAAGTASAAQFERLLGHAGSCQRCFQRLTEAMDDLNTPISAEEKAQLESLPVSNPNWPAEMAARLDELRCGHLGHSRLSGEQVGQQFWLNKLVSWWRIPQLRVAWLAVAAVILVAGSLLVWRYSNSQADQLSSLVKQAYLENRTLPTRFEGLDYAPLVSTTRSGKQDNTQTTSVSPALLDAESYVLKHRSLEQGNAPFLQNAARVDLLRGDFNGAITNLEAASQIQPDSAPLLIDLSSAYLALSQIESGKKRIDDLELAMIAIDKAVEKSPQDPVALFNRALTLEAQGLLYQAAEAWQKFLDVENTGPWADEARKHQTEIQKQLQKSEDYQRNLHESPHAPITSHIDSEDLLKWAAPTWLVNGDSESGQKLSVLAQRLNTEHHDPWLLDLRNSAPPAALQAMGYVMLANSQDKPDEALASADAAMKMMLAAGSSAGYARSGYEIAYAHQRRTEASACRKEAAHAAKQSGLDRYPWLAAQLHIAEGNCANMLSDFAAAQQELSKAGQYIDRGKFATLRLRLLGMQAGLDDNRGDASRAFEENLQGVALYRGAPTDMERGFQFYSELGYMGEDYGAPHLGWLYFRESARMADVIGKPTLAAMAWMQAVSLGEALEMPEAAADFARAQALFAALPNTAANNVFRAEGQIHHAGVKLSAGDAAAADALLQQVHVENSTSHDITVRLYVARGDVLLAQGQKANAAVQYALAEHELAGPWQQSSDEKDRLLRSRLGGGVYRRLIELDLAQGDPDRAFEQLVAYRELILGGPTANSTRGPSPALINDPDRGQLAYLYLERGLAVFYSDSEGLQYRYIVLPRRSVAEAFEHFTTRCSTPFSSVADLTHDARVIGSWLVEPFLPQLAHRRRLTIIPDESLPVVPFEAVGIGQGYVIDRWQVEVAMMPAADSKHTAVSAGWPVLVVANSAGGLAQGLSLAPLPGAETEARDVASHFTSARLLSNQAATPGASTEAMRHASIFHFAGHAIADSDSAGLVLASLSAAGTGEAALLRASDIRKQRLPQLRLVVLSACGTARSGYADYLNPDGLVRAFLDVSPAVVVASLWNVDSAATAAYMRAFYKSLASGSDVEKAQSAAVTQVRNSKSWGHPYYWAGFSNYTGNYKM